VLIACTRDGDRQAERERYVVLVVNCVVLLLIVSFFMLIVLFYVLCVCVCTVLLPPGVNPTAVNKYFIWLYIACETVK